MGSWGYKVFENDSVLDIMFQTNNENFNTKEFVRQTLKNKLNENEYKIVLAMALVDASLNGPDKKIFCENSDNFYGHKLYLEKLPNMSDLIPDVINAGKYLLSIEDDIGWRKPILRKIVIQNILLKILLYQNNYSISDFNLIDFKIEQERKRR